MFKKVLAVGFSAVLALSLVACGGSKDNKSKSSKETTTASESEAATVYSVKDEKIKVDSGVIKLADYSQLTVYEDDVKVTDDSYKSQVDYILEQSATYKDTKSAKISSVDKVKVDYTGQIKYKGKKVTFEGGTASDQEIDLGNNSSGYIDGFTKALEGQHKVGDKFTKKLKFPDTYTNNTKIDGKEVKLAGKTVWFTFTIKSISTKSVPKLTDKFVKEKFGAYGVTDVKSFEKYAREHPEEQVVFLSVGFETTTPAECLSVKKAKKDGLMNYSLLMANKTMPQAYEALKGSADIFLYPGHVNAITGTELCEKLTEDGVSGVVAGFTAKELLTALAVALVKFQEGKPFFVNCYPRVVKAEGSREAQQLTDEMTEACDSEWRGLGVIPGSGVCLKEDWSAFDARKKYDIPPIQGKANPACRCGDVLQGKCKPSDCKVFGKVCTPQHPVGACMVSNEGACSAFYAYGDTQY